MMDITTLIIGAIAALLTQGAKKVSNIDISPNREKLLRRTAAIFAFVGVVLVRVADGTIADEAFILSTAQVIGESAFAYFTSYLTYKSLIQKKKSTIPTQ